MDFRVLVWQDEDGVFFVECPALPGCNSQGKTRPEALANITEAIELYLEDLKLRGDPIPPPISEETVHVKA
jgi:predicted RNase H-like HicB family nuclease